MHTTIGDTEKADEGSDILILPKPGQAVDRDDRRFETVQLTLSKLNIDKLKDYLKAYGLRVSGKRAELVTRLREFANKPEEWSSLLLQPARTRRRGDISERAAQKNRTAKRIIQTFGAQPSESTFLPKKSGTATRAPIALSEQQISAMGTWATLVVDRATKRNPLGALANTVAECDGGQGSMIQERRTAEQGEDGRQTTTIRRLDHRVASGHSAILQELTDVKTQLRGLHNHLATQTQTQTQTQMPQPAISTSTLPARQWSSHPQASAHNLDGPAQTLSCQTFGSPSAHVPEVSPHVLPTIVNSDSSLSTTSANLMVLELDGKTLRFDKARVPNPPKVTFAHDVSRLLREWHSSDLLRVDGHGIPIKHWECLYKKRVGIKEHAWDSIRVQWGNWKFIVAERERFPSEDAFWARYSEDNGKHFNFQKILDTLQGGRKDEDEKDAAAALRFFENDLTHPRARGYFHYKKTGRVHVCTKTQAIATKWRALLRDHPDIARQWELSRDELEG